MKLDSKFQVLILKKEDVGGGGGSFNSPLRRISWLRGLRGIGFIYSCIKAGIEVKVFLFNLLTIVFLRKILF